MTEAQTATRPVTAEREAARAALRTYLMRSGLTARQFADQMGYSWHSIRQFISAGRYGDGDGRFTADAVLAWIADNPLPAPQLPGKLYPTRATRQMDALLDHAANGGWGTLYGPSGAQKTFVLEYRRAEAAQRDDAAEPRILYVRCSSSGMTAPVLLRRIAAELRAPFAQSADALRQSILITIRRRKTSAALVLDEADMLDRWVETLETLREIGDLCRARNGFPGLGILIAGNEGIVNMRASDPATKGAKALGLFRDRRGISFEKWRGRLEQKELRVLGPSPDEGAAILAGELGDAPEAARQAVVERCLAVDPYTRRSYVNMHRLANAIRDVKRARGRRPETVQ